MQTEKSRSGAVETRLQAMSDDAFLLAEANHRVSNELAAALAALRLILAAKGSRSRWRLLGHAVDRLEAFSATHRHFAAQPPLGIKVDVGASVELICSSLATAQDSARDSILMLDAKPAIIDGNVARTLSLVANELITNAIKYGLAGRSGHLWVSLRDHGEIIKLVVTDDGPGMSSAGPCRGTGLGSGIVGELVRRANGAVAIITGPSGTSVTVTLPHSGGRDDVA